MTIITKYDIVYQDLSREGDSITPTKENLEKYFLPVQQSFPGATNQELAALFNKRYDQLSATKTDIRLWFGYCDDYGLEYHRMQENNEERKKVTEELGGAQKKLDNGLKVKKDEDGDYKEIVAEGGEDNLGFEDIMDLLDFDPDAMDLQSIEPSKWETTGRDEVNNALRAKLVNPDMDNPKWPDIKPIVVEPKLTRQTPQKPPTETGWEKVLIVPDSQNGFVRDNKNGKLIPFHDRQAWDITLKIAEDEQPHKIVFLGDMIDLPNMTDHFDHPKNMQQTLQPTTLELNWWLQSFRKAVPHAEMYYLEGNHETRLPNAVQNNMKEAHGVKPADDMDGDPTMSVPRLLGLDSLDIEYVGDYPNGEVWINDGFVCKHKGKHSSSKPGLSSKKNVKDATSSMVFGHIHSRELVEKTLWHKDEERRRVVFSPGTLARLGGHTPANRKKNNWQNGLALVHYEPDGKKIQENIIKILEDQEAESGNRYAIHDDKRYEGETRIKQIRQDIDWSGF